MKIFITLVSTQLFMIGLFAQNPLPYNPDHTIQTIKGLSQYSVTAEKQEFSYRTSLPSATESFNNYNYARSYNAADFSTGWGKGLMFDSSNDMVDSGYLMNYDYAAQRLFIKTSQGDDLQEISNAQISFFSFYTNKLHCFIPASKFINKDTTDFFEILSINVSKISLLKFVEPVSGELQSTFYIWRDSTLTEIKPDEKNLEKNLPDQKEKINNYLKTYSYDLDADHFLSNIIEYLNS